MPRLRAPRHRSSPPPADALYGYGYRPDWPSVLAVAHDEADGGRLYLYTDRPCALAGPALPLEIVGTTLAVIGAEVVSPIKFHLAMDGAVPAGAVWRWPGGDAPLYDPTTGARPNAGSGTCSDTPGPYTPPPTANVVGTWCDGGFECTLTFDLPVALTGDEPDDAMTFDGAPPISVSQDDPYTLRFVTPVGVSPGEAWVIARQPAWVVTLLTSPAAGTF